ncbi:hypothetical protein PR048_003561 [Dryococelus australis]|uniref:Uncharacterized protein n=1 Tax=Dryococelus australis TaxID=614101 RepID=A0ABQ9INF5_9NEOP|nr:hypothetical protein PR048_003561 [Dryococelus australis]
MSCLNQIERVVLESGVAGTLSGARNMYVRIRLSILTFEHRERTATPICPAIDRVPSLRVFLGNKLAYCNCKPAVKRVEPRDLGDSYIEILRTDRGESEVWSSARMQGRGKQELLEKNRSPAASSGRIPTCENPGIESGSPRDEGRSVAVVTPEGNFVSRQVSRGAVFLKELMSSTWKHHSGWFYKLGRCEVVADAAMDTIVDRGTMVGSAANLKDVDTVADGAVDTL